MKFRKFAFVWLAGLLALALSACGSALTPTLASPTTAPATQPAASLTTAPTGGLTLTVWDFFPPNPSPERDAMIKVANEWAAKTGNKVVDPGQIPDAVTKFKTAAPAGQGPDIIMQPQDQEGALVAAGLLAPPPTGLITPDLTSRYAPVSLQAITLKGQLYGLPLARESYFLFYNKKLVQSPPKTWQELVTQATALTQGDQYGFLWDTTNFYYDYAFIAGYGGYLFNLTSTGYDPTSLGLNTSGSIEGFKFIQDLVQTDKLVPPSTTTDIMEGKFAGGQAAMIIDGPWAVSGFKSKGVDFGVAPLPTLPNGNPMKPFVGIQGLYVSSHSQHIAAAWDLAKYLSLNLESPLYDASGRVPVLTALSQSPKVQSDPVAQAVIAMSDQGGPMPNIPAMSVVWTPMSQELTLLVTGKATSDQAATGAQQKIVQAISTQSGGQ